MVYVIGWDLVSVSNDLDDSGTTVEDEDVVRGLCPDRPNGFITVSAFSRIRAICAIALDEPTAGMAVVVGSIVIVVVDAQLLSRC
jgi:hypothetical protein